MLSHLKEYVAAATITLSSGCIPAKGPHSPTEIHPSQVADFRRELRHVTNPEAFLKMSIEPGLNGDQVIYISEEALVGRGMCEEIKNPLYAPTGIRIFLHAQNGMMLIKSIQTTSGHVINKNNLNHLSPNHELSGRLVAIAKKYHGRPIDPLMLEKILDEFVDAFNSFSAQKSPNSLSDSTSHASNIGK